MNGQGVVQDDAQALAWFRKGADAGSAEAMFKLPCTTLVVVLPRMPPKPPHGYRKAAEAGVTVGAVEIRLNRQAVLIELNPQYCEIIEKRLSWTRAPKRPQIGA
jgi:TPR repeat protein